MTKFKVGDKVRVVELVQSDESDGIEMGKVYEVLESNNTLVHISVQSPIFGNYYPMYESQLELVKKDKHKTELRIVYKVVSNCPPYKLVSYWGVSDYELEYVIGKQTKTPKGWNPLFAFDTLEHARMEHPDILKCVAKVRVDDNDFSFMNGGFFTPPTGTVLCDWVFPIERVGSE